ncbi:PAS domain-containing protein [Jannaschia sp. Os4]|uniref:PAS domain-containing protein n=1 Tax=Jannaschia sp. Os4 TaxID=2807617 RepID=UPI0019396560|nr:PAS domain-containing protein [Jannaschia sp. Os4]MBM2576611.1 PAS domain-containing protein [Jannaschia sp. Os4]
MSEISTIGGGEVVDLATARARRMPDVLSRLWRVWNRLAGPDGVPFRGDLTPDALGDLMPHLLFADHVRPGCTRVAAAGSAWDLPPGGATGLPVRAFFDLGDRDPAAALVERAFDGPSTVDLKLRGARMLVLPLRGETGRATKAVLGLSVSAYGPEGRFELDGHTVTRLDAPPKVERPAPQPLRVVG